jgi:hypothetical protein
MLTNRPARLTFTYDYHELLRGDLRPGCSVLVRYDPKRIVPEGEPYLFGDPNAPIVAHAAFHAGDAPVSKPVISEAGVIEQPIVDVTGQGSMLTATFDVPDDAAEMILWFSYASPASGMHYDSDEGQNFRFSFPSRELRVVAADVVTDEQAHESVFTVEIACNTLVDRVLVRIRAVNHEDFKQEIDLVRGEAAGDPQGWPHWTLPRTVVPYGAIIEFKIYYWMWNVRYKDDNSGRYYLVPAPKRAVPPPPPELAAAAQRWGQPPASGSGR